MSWSHTCEFDGDTRWCGACQDERRVEEAQQQTKDTRDVLKKFFDLAIKLVYDVDGCVSIACFYPELKALIEESKNLI